MRPRQLRHGEAGQGLVEMAVALPLFLLILVAVFDVGRLVYTNSALSQAAREGARLAAAEAAWVGISTGSCVASESAITDANPGAHVCRTNPASLKSNVEGAVNRMAVSLGALSDIHISCNAGTAGDPAPSGEWVEPSGGNGCDDGSGNSIPTIGSLCGCRSGAQPGALVPTATTTSWVSVPWSLLATTSMPSGSRERQ